MCLCILFQLSWKFWFKIWPVKVYVPLSSCILVLRLFLPLPAIRCSCSFFSVCHHITLIVDMYIPDVNKLNIINSNTSLMFGFQWILAQWVMAMVFSQPFEPQFLDLLTLLVILLCTLSMWNTNSGSFSIFNFHAEIQQQSTTLKFP